MKKYLVLGLLVLAAYFIGRATTPSKEVIKLQTKIEYRDKETITVKVKHPDGTIETKKTIKDKSVIQSESKSSSKPVDKLYHVALLMSPEKQYGLLIEKKLGDLSVGIAGFTNNTYFLTVGLSF